MASVRIHCRNKRIPLLTAILSNRTRYRAPFVGLKAETHPPPRLISPASASASPICNQLSAVPAWKLDPRNPFISWYDRSGRSRTSNGASVDSVKPKSGPKTDIPRFKDDLLHVNYVRAAKILVRRSQVDRERLTWWEYWLGTRECAPPQSYESESIVEKVSSEHPDVRDVWDLLEKRVGRFHCDQRLEAEVVTMNSLMTCSFFLNISQVDATSCSSSSTCTILAVGTLVIVMRVCLRIP